MATHAPAANCPRFHLAFPAADRGQALKFFLVPFGNALEFEAFPDINPLFSRNP
jgi:extradiol dioxygenase family protein